MYADSMHSYDIYHRNRKVMGVTGATHHQAARKAASRGYDRVDVRRHGDTKLHAYALERIENPTTTVKNGVALYFRYYPIAKFLGRH